MLFLLSPAKSLDYDTPTPPELAPALTRPQFLDDTAALIAILRDKSVADVRALMDLSEPLAQLNVDRYAAWRPRFTDKNSKPAMLAFDGDVYDGLDAKTLSADDLAWAQQHVRMLSGLYGLLRPLDRMQPYRLEMGARLANPHGASLYDWWGDRLALHLNKLAKAEKAPVIVNLASQEYFRAADRKALKPRVVDCQFEDWKNGDYKIISFFAKRARGLMARYAIRQRLQTPEELQGFDLDGYRLAPEVSSPDRLVFRRKP
ncbi:peroxide stress protein YaaA [Roseateles sp.]|uniref:peroxide stress protein YaaA n=1 Tax=Roseateles sp. TaxID=1971397 RepID=UPI0025DDF417|nr:peroxide stress protein YaaA [Roseateles sp.]MBV8035267.1 peroxide stress protein YaaA [Roseateles sp.]